MRTGRGCFKVHSGCSPGRSRRGRRRLVAERQQRVSTHPPLINTVVAEAPFTLVAGFAAPVAVVGPGRALAAEGAALETEGRVVGREGATALGTAGDLLGGQVAVCGEHVRGREGWVFGASFVEARPGGVAEAEPVEAAFGAAPAVEADVPVAVVADGAVVVEVVFDVVFFAAHAGYEGFFEAGEFGSLRGGERWGAEAGA